MNAELAEVKVEVAAYTVAEAARELGASLTTVYRWLKEGRLQIMTTLGGSAILVTAESVARYKREREAVQ